MNDEQSIFVRERAATGIGGLDTILGGGVPTDRIYLIQGDVGAGKTTLGFQFLLEGAAAGQSVLYASLLQTRGELRDVADSHGWSLDDVIMLELPEDVQQTAEAEQTVFSPAEVELHEVVDTIIDTIRRHRPRRMVLDSLSELQVLIDNPSQLRRQLTRLKRALLESPCTTLVTASGVTVEQTPTIQTIVHGAIQLIQDLPPYGEPRRALRIEKMRGIDFAGGYHDFQIRVGGLEVYPRLADVNGTGSDSEVVSSGIAELDELFGGGLNLGSACMVMGTSGAGKSTLTALYAQAMAARGAPVSIYCFDESRSTYLRRADNLNLRLADHVPGGRIALRQYQVGELTPGQLVKDLCRDLNERSIRLVVIDSFTGYINLMLDQPYLTTKMHELLRYLSSRNVLTLMTVNLHGLFGEVSADIDVSYLADSVVLMRHFEARGSVRKCISMLKKRHGSHEKSIRELMIEPGGIRLGPPLHDFSGVFTGSPQYHGNTEQLLDSMSDQADGGD